MAKAAAGVTRSSHWAAPNGSNPATPRMNGSTITTIAAVTAAALRRSMVPSARARTVATASRAAVPATTRSQVSQDTGNTYVPWSRDSRTPTTTAMTAATRPAANMAEAITMALAARTRPRRGVAASVVRIRPRRYSAVMNMTPMTTITISAANAPMR